MAGWADGHGRDILPGEGICCVGDQKTCLDGCAGQYRHRELEERGVEIPTDFAHSTITSHHTLLSRVRSRVVGVDDDPLAFSD